MLRQEDDVAWRSDTLIRLASLPAADERAAVATSLSSTPATAAEGEPLPDPQFGRKLNYRDVFRGQQNSQTQTD